MLENVILATQLSILTANQFYFVIANILAFDDP